MNKLVGFSYNDGSSTIDYFYLSNIFGDIIAILDSNGNEIAKYVYDAFGNHLVLDNNGIVNSNPSFIGNINPFRYRGYYFDIESSLYYCISRYYDPSTGRFISPDSIDYLDSSSINGLNLYLYCGNNPVMFVDLSGCFFFSALLIGALVGGVIGAGVSAISQLATGDHIINPWQFLLDGTIGGN